MSSLVVIILAVAIGLILVLVVSLYYNSLVVLGNSLRLQYAGESRSEGPQLPGLDPVQTELTVSEVAHD